jgi:hypothetical protein
MKSPRSHLGALRVESTRQTEAAAAPALPFSRSESVDITAGIFDRACTLDGRTESVLAASCDVSVTQLRAWRDAQSGRRAPLWALLALRPEAVRLAVDSLLAWSSPSAMVVDVPETTGDLDLARIASVTKESADVVVHGIEAHARGHMTRAEGAAGERECDELLKPVLAYREVCRRAKAEGVIGMVKGTRGVS